MLPRAILRISRDLTPKFCSILLKAPGWGYQLLGLNRMHHKILVSTLLWRRKPGDPGKAWKTRNGAERRVLAALSRESPWESHWGSKEKLIWDLFPHHLTARTAWWCSSACQSQGKLILEEFLLSKTTLEWQSHSEPGARAVFWLNLQI